MVLKLGEFVCPLKLFLNNVLLSSKVTHTEGKLSGLILRRFAQLPKLPGSILVNKRIANGRQIFWINFKEICTSPVASSSSSDRFLEANGK